MTWPYDRGLLEIASASPWKRRSSFTRVFVAVAGPNLETRAEYRFLRGIGADVVRHVHGPEVIVGVHGKSASSDCRSSPTNVLPDALHPVSLEEVIAVATAAEPKLRTLVRRVVTELACV